MLVDSRLLESKSQKTYRLRILERDCVKKKTALIDIEILRT